MSLLSDRQKDDLCVVKARLKADAEASAPITGKEDLINLRPRVLYAVAVLPRHTTLTRHHISEGIPFP